MLLLDNYLLPLKNLCKKHKVKTLFAFGSILNEKFNDESDVDLIVNFEEIELLSYADNFFDFKFSLEKIFNRSIDLLEEEAIKNPFFLQNINDQKKLIYG